MAEKIRKRKYRQRELTEKERKIAIGYMTHGDKHRAYVEAGYARFSKRRYEVDRAQEILNSPRIKEFTRITMEKAAEKTILSVAKVLDNYNTIYEKAIADGDYTAATRAMELYGKHLGMFIERTENVNRNLNFKTLEDVDREIKRLADLQGLQLSKGTETRQ
ncbi:MAG TPA: terminase small subunit [Prosthecobacter sp.]|nr:terminase small subunit [Prosthecobacter sp.]